MRARGFTLIEILVVLIIVGLTLALVQINLTPGENTLIKDETIRLETVLKVAQDQVSAGGEPLALELRGDGYRFYARRDSQWQPQTESPLGPHVFPDGIRWGRLLVDNAAVTPPKRIIWQPGAHPPQLDLQLVGASRSERLTVDPLGRVENVASEAR